MPIGLDWRVRTAVFAGIAAGVATLGAFFAHYRPWSRWGYQNRNKMLAKYINDYNKIEDATLNELREMTIKRKDGIMTTAVETERFLTIICRSIGAKKVLDVGVFTGCSAYAMAKGLPEEGKVIACDINEVTIKLGQPYWKQGGVNDKIDVRIQPATQTLQELVDNGEEGTFDLMFIDANKEEYPKYFEYGMKLLRPGGLFVVDNAFWFGRVPDPSWKDERTLAIRRMNKLMKSHPGVDTVLLNIGDGTGFGQKL